MHVALVHDFLIRLGGAERVLHVLAEMFPDAPIYTLLYDEKKVGAKFPSKKIAFSGLQKLPSILRRNYKYLLPRMPLEVEAWDFSKFDLVISSSSAFVHGIVTPVHTHHICYVHSPMRSLWDWTHEYLHEQRLDFMRRLSVIHFLNKIRVWDYFAASRADRFIANSHNVRRRIKKYYRSDSTVVYPPVDTQHFSLSKKKENYFLIISNLTTYKRIDLAIGFFNRIRKKLIIIGDGLERQWLQNISGSTIEFLGSVDDDTAHKYLRNCRALIFPGEEDFGITPVEAMSCGKAVLAYGKGGVTESIIPGVTGEFFEEPTISSMESGLARLLENEDCYTPEACRSQAEKFSKEVFVQKMKQIISSPLI